MLWKTGAPFQVWERERVQLGAWAFRDPTPTSGTFSKYLTSKAGQALSPQRVQPCAFLAGRRISGGETGPHPKVQWGALYDGLLSGRG